MSQQTKRVVEALQEIQRRMLAVAAGATTRRTVLTTDARNLNQTRAT